MGQRLLAERVDIGKVMEGFMDRAHKEFTAAPAYAERQDDKQHGPPDDEVDRDH